MMMPGFLGENLFDNFMEGFAFPNIDKTLYGKHAGNLMKTDVKETETGYEVDIDLPGFKKEELKLQLKDGYLTVHADKSVEKDEKNETGNYIRRERYSGSMSRRYFVGNHVTDEDVHPRYENGILTFCIPKAEFKAVEEKNHYIAIEG